jgi:hypothetical protein
MTDPQTSEFIDDLFKEDQETGCFMRPIDVPSSTLRNHRYANDGGQRKLYVTADILPQDLNAQSDFILTEQLQQAINKKGYMCDEPALIIPAEFGGTGDWRNVFPQSKHVS